MSYYQKYIKYKNKYLDLKNGGSYKGGDNTTLLNDNIKGAIIGALIGDALGTRYDFMSSIDATTQIEADMVNNTLPILGGGPFNVKAGHQTFKSEIMISLLESIITNKNYIRDDVINNYKKWYYSAKKTYNVANPIINKSNVKSYNYSSLETINKVFNVKDLKDKTYSDVYLSSIKLNEHMINNGSIFRVIPLSFIHIFNNDIPLAKLIEQDSNITHPNKLIINFNLIYAYALQLLFDGTSLDTIYNNLYNSNIIEPRTRIILRDAKLNRNQIYIIDNNFDEIYIDNDDIKHNEYIGVAFQNAFRELFNEHTNFEQSMINIAKKGGDVSANCFITGALLGAHYGFSAIPQSWIKNIHNIDEIIDILNI